MNKKQDLLREVRNLLEYRQAMGVSEIPVVCSPSPTPHPSTPRKATDKGTALKALFHNEIDGCTRCRLCEGRKHIVFGVGNADADLMFVGEGPGHDEDIKGEPFVGRAGQLLTKIIEAMGFKRSDVYIANVVKCRPPNNRQPAPDEMETCLPYLRKQIAIIEPKVIVCLGATAARGLLRTETAISRLRGQWQEWDHIKVMPTYHPAFLLRNPAMKKPVWEDMQKVMEFLKDTR